MEKKTKVTAEAGKHDMKITRDFELPLDVLFTAFAEPDLVGQWMGTNVMKLESKKHGSWQYRTTDANGNVLFQASGVIHEYIPNAKIIRTFEMENTPFGVQLEVYEFETTGDSSSRLNMHVIYESVEQRDQVLKMPFAQGLNMAHDRMEQLLKDRK